VANRQRFTTGMIALAAILLAATGVQAVPQSGNWQASALVDHPLVGRVWSTREQRFAGPDDVLEAARRASFVLLGEKHDNPDHHRLQAWIVERSAAPGDGVVFEMLSAEEETALTEVWRGGDTDLEALGQALRWEERGWFTWAIYRPIFGAIAETGAVPRTGDVARDKRKAVSRGFDILGPGVAREWALDRPLEDPARAALARHIVDGHCGLLPSEAVGPVINVQRARDAAMAQALLKSGAGAAPQRRFLIAGGGHARKDYGVPWYLRARGVAEKDILVIAMLEVDEGETDPQAALGVAEDGAAPADYVWFTPRVDTQDPCEKYAEQLKAFKKHRPKPDAE